MADLDGDGLPEIVFGTYFNDESIHCLNGEDGSHLWTYPTGGCNDASPVIWDVDEDGQLEVIVPGSATQTMYCINGATGILEWSTNEGHCIDSPPSIADMDGDGDLEIVNGTFNGYVFCLDADSGHVAWVCSLGTDSAIESCANLHDFDGDGHMEAVVAQWQGDCRVYCIDGMSGDIDWSSQAPGDWMYHGGSFADVDGDGLPEISIGSYDGNVYLLNGEDGTTEWTYSASAYACGPTSISDLNRDGQLEVFYATGSGVGVISADGSGIWNCAAGGSVFRGAAVSEINGDTIPEVIYGSSGGDLYVRKGSDGELVWELDLQAHYGDTYDIDHCPVTGDFDGDGCMDVFVVGGHGTSSSPQDNHGRAYMITAGPAAGEGWSMFRHDRFRSGFFQCGSTGIETQSPSYSTISLSCRPNPCRGTTEAIYYSDTPQQIRLEVYDLHGRLIMNSGTSNCQTGWQQLDIDLSGRPSGIYFVNVSHGQAFDSARVLLIE